jgi:transposase
MVNLLAVDEMASGGLSRRAIAKAVGVSEATVRRILRGSRVNATKAASHAVAAAIPCV